MRAVRATIYRVPGSGESWVNPNPAPTAPLIGISDTKGLFKSATNVAVFVSTNESSEWRRKEQTNEIMSDQQTMVAEPEVVTKKQDKKKPKKQPRYNVILWDDSDHSYEYVVLMMKQIFRHPIETGFQIAKEVDTSGRAICMTTTMEHAELKRDQIHSYGKDELIARCKGSMSATIEPVNE